MGYVPERITDYPQEIDDRPLHIDAEKLAQAVEQYYEDPIGVKVALAIATFADSKGVAFPGIRRLSDMTGFTWTEVSKAVGRLQALGILTVTRRRFKNSNHSHNEYRFRKDFVHRIADKCSSHFLPNVQKWKAKAKDVAAAVVRHASDTVVNTVSGMASKIAAVVQAHPEKEEEFLANPEKAAAMALDKPAMGVPEPVSEPVSAPAGDVSDEDRAKMFQVFDAHPELLNNPEEAARLAGVVLPDMKPSKPVSKPVEETPVKQETSLETLPANTTSTVGSANIQTDMTNAPKFINGEVDSRWVSERLLHQLNPNTYPAY